MKTLNVFIFVLSAILLLIFAGIGDAHPVQKISKNIDTPFHYIYITYKNGNHVWWGFEGLNYKIMTVNNNGNTVKNITINFGIDTFASEMIPTSDGGIAVIAQDNFNNILIKYDASYKEQWHKTWKREAGSGFNRIVQISDGGYIILGNIFNNGADQMYLMRTDSSGNEKFSRVLNYDFTYFYPIHNTRDSGYLVAGSIRNGDVLILKFDPSDNIQWNRTINGYTEEFNIEPVSDGGYIISGYLEEPEDYPGLYPNGWIAKLDGKGKTKWLRTISNSSYNTIHSIMETRDGNYLAVGGIEKGNEMDGLIVKFSKKGSKKWSFSAGGTERDTFQMAVETSKNKFALFGQSDPAGMWFVKVYDQN